MITQAAYLLMIPLAFTLSCLLVMWVRRYISHVHEQSQQPGLTIIKQLGQMLKQVYAHRELCKTELENEVVDAVKIDLLQKDVAASINKIIGVAEDMSRDGRWMGIVEHWGRLSVHYHNLAPESCAAQHNRLLSNILRVIDDRARYYDFEALVTEIAVLDKSWDSLLNLTDHVYQACAIGQHAFASGDPLTPQKLRLRFLHRNISNNLEPGHLSPVIESVVRQPVEAFNACIEDLIVDQPPPIATTPYFRLAGEAKSALDEQFSEQIKRLQLGIKVEAERS